MEHHTVKFNTAKKNKDGFVKLLVKFDDWYIPMLGKPVPLVDEDFENVMMGEWEKECNRAGKIKRLNLTRWILKDIPRIAKLIGSLADGTTSWLFYYNGSEGSWKFYDRPFTRIGEDSDDFDYKIGEVDSFVETWDNQFYRPHYDCHGNFGDDSVHGVYSDDLKCVLGKEKRENRILKDYDPNYTAESFAEVCDPVEFIKNIPAKVGIARKNHKRIPYEKIGSELYAKIVNRYHVDFYSLGRDFYRLVKELRENV